ncbi:MAG TPA: NAD-dependent deacylase [Isosphaeraceae bacterium]|jgi:NAD-dependent deacetylase
MEDLGRAARLVAGAGHVAVLTGAGVSAESGIPTFRGLGGLWRGRDPMSLATPEAFAATPELVWEFYNWRREIVARAEPNPAHLALAELARRVGRLTLVTQNVDRLHQRAGSRDVIELHGNLGEVLCSACRRRSDRTGDALPPLPRCQACGGLLRPAVVWFGEALPADELARASAAVRAADVLLVVGTSAVVYPAAGLIALARGPVIEVNLEPTAASARVAIALFGKAGEILPRLVPPSPAPIRSPLPPGEGSGQ